MDNVKNIIGIGGLFADTDENEEEYKKIEQDIMNGADDIDLPITNPVNEYNQALKKISNDCNIDMNNNNSSYNGFSNDLQGGDDEGDGEEETEEEDNEQGMFPDDLFDNSDPNFTTKGKTA